MDVDISQVAGAQSDFTLMALFWQAHLVVKIVMIGLVVASVVCWAIIIEKILLVGRSRRLADRFEKLFWSGKSLEELETIFAKKA